ncbi:MAG TPA: GtrA family protein [Acetobacteraceae bacterium]|nr:GtrA family protein [Acetobacteraceae bacterium]
MSVLDRLLSPLDRIRPGMAQLGGQFFRFGVVGTAGFIVDTGVLYAMLALGAGPYLGRVPAYLAAATTTWALNRAWTFQARSSGPVGRQWVLFVAVNLIGFALNYGTYAACIAFWPLAAAHPVIAVAAGSIAGLFSNFTLSRALVFTPARG